MGVVGLTLLYRRYLLEANFVLAHARCSRSDTDNELFHNSEKKVSFQVSHKKIKFMHPES